MAPHFCRKRMFFESVWRITFRWRPRPTTALCYWLLPARISNFLDWRNTHSICIYTRWTKLIERLAIRKHRSTSNSLMTFFISVCIVDRLTLLIQTQTNCVSLLTCLQPLRCKCRTVYRLCMIVCVYNIRGPITLIVIATWVPRVWRNYPRDLREYMPCSRQKSWPKHHRPHMSCVFTRTYVDLIDHVRGDRLKKCTGTYPSKGEWTRGWNRPNARGQ